MYPYYLYIHPPPPKRKKIVPIIVIIAIFVVVVFVFVMTNNSSSDCVGAWSSCSSTCGCGTKTYTITTQKTGDGKDCETTNGKKENCNTDICPLDCNLIQNKIQTYYNTEGQWKGIYTMEPITTNKVSNNECDVKYKYNPAPGSSKTDKGEDKRRFTFTPTNSCPNTWNVTSMGAHHSGTTL